MMRQPPKFREALEVLAGHRVDFVVVGGVAGVLGGAPISTFDLDIVHDRAPTNVARLLAALTNLDARYRDLSGHILHPDARGLEGAGHHLLLTRCGPLDVLGNIGSINTARSYQDLLPDSVLRPLGDITIHVLGLEALIRAKTEANRDKDRAVLAILRHTLEESRKQG